MRLVTDSLNISMAKFGQIPSTIVKMPSGTKVRISRPLISGSSSYLGLSVPKEDPLKCPEEVCSTYYNAYRGQDG